MAEVCDFELIWSLELFLIMALFASNNEKTTKRGRF